MFARSPYRLQSKAPALAKEKHVCAAYATSTGVAWCGGGECRETDDGTCGLMSPRKAGVGCHQHRACTDGLTAEKE